MKRILTSVASVGWLLLSTATVHAQQLGVVYNIPFAFNAMGQNLSAGRYTQVDLAHGTAAMLRNDSQAIMFLTPNVLEANPGDAELVFEQYGNKFFLRQVWNSEGRGTSIPMSDEEREIRRSQDRATVIPQKIVVAAGH